jgi:hypothetical protein
MEPYKNQNVIKEVCKHIVDKKVKKDVKIRQLDIIDKGLDSSDKGKITKTLI